MQKYPKENDQKPTVKAKSKAQKPVIQRNKYSLDQKDKARHYYTIGLSVPEISKLTDTPIRTLEKWQLIEKWKDLKNPFNIKSKVLELLESGKSYKEVSQLLNISNATIYRYSKEAKEVKQAKATNQQKRL